MPTDQVVIIDEKNGPIVAGCHDSQSRGVKPIEAPCPLCGEIQEFFSDELRTKEQVRCYDCKELFDTAVYRKSAGIE